MKKLLPLLCLLLTASMAMAYQATIFGFVKEANGTAVPYVPVLVKIIVNNAQIQSQTVLTQSNGKYLAVFTIDDNIQEAHAIIEVADCNNIELSKTVGFSKNNPNADAHFIWCASVGCELEVGIEKIQNNNGAYVLKAHASGGTPPYVYLWSSGQTSQIIEISPNHKDYCVIVTDQNGCTGKACYELVNQEDCAVEIEKVNLDNAGTKIKLVASTKGNAPFTYLWSTGETTLSIIPPHSGTYCVTITSVDGCTAQDCIAVEIKSNTDCGVEIKVHQWSNGGLQLEAIPKGVAPFTYKWNTGSTDKTIVVEKPGEYCVIVTDANGCEAKICYVWKETKDCGVEIHVVYDGGKAKLTANAKGAAPFTYHWSNGATTQTIVVEKPGEYCVNIIDANGCESKACVNVKFPNTSDCGVKILIIKTLDPSIVKLAAITSGPGNFTYKWSNGATTMSILVEIPGEYCVVVTNGAGCEAKACVHLKKDNPKDCGVEIVKQPAVSVDKMILKALPKGMAPFTYLWNTGETTQSIAIEKPGEYCVVVIDANGCEAKSCILIKGKDEGPKDCAVYIKLKYHDVAGFFSLFAVTKGVPPFSFAWSTGATSQSIEVKEPGLYCVTVTNDEGCEAVTCIEIEKDGFTGPGQNDTGFKVMETYPQPAQYEVNYKVSMPFGGSLNFEVVNMNGELVQTAGFDYLEAGEHHLQLPIQDLSAGVFFVRIKTDTEQVLSKLIKTN
ncbi:MAG: T9SS type A sorting domain-containing protein [Saprospiraceae bacterium]|nr:T9SS type A sorting domain-containing protein [Saprospiraceae bacterium]